MTEMNRMALNMKELYELDLCGVSINTDSIENFKNLTKLSLISDTSDGCWSYFTGYSAAAKMTKFVSTPHWPSFALPDKYYSD